MRKASPRAAQRSLVPPHSVEPAGRADWGTKEIIEEGAIIREDPLEPKGFDIEEGEGLPEEVGIDCCEVHLFPSRTQKLSSHAPTILAG